MTGVVSLEGARCAVHPDLVARFVCARCGNFGCTSCRAPHTLFSGNEHCNACGGANARAIRQAHLRHEHSARSIGSLYLFGAVMFCLGFSAVGIADIGRSGEENAAIASSFVFAGLAFGTIGAAVGWGLRRFRPWARIVATIFSSFGLLGIPIGTLIHGYMLYLMWSDKGKVVYSPEYQDVIAATPDMRYRNPTWVWIAFGILLLLLMGAVTFAIMKT